MSFDTPLGVEFTVDVDGKSHRIVFSELIRSLKIDPLDIEREASDQPGVYGWVGALAEQATYHASQAKRALNLYRASMSKDLRRVPPKHLKRVTNSALEAEIETDSTTQTLEEEYVEAQRVADLMAIAKEAARARAGLIRELAARQRQEEGHGG